LTSVDPNVIRRDAVINKMVCDRVSPSPWTDANDYPRYCVVRMRNLLNACLKKWALRVADMSKISIVEFLPHFVVCNTEGEALQQTLRINRRLSGAKGYLCVMVRARDENTVLNESRI